MRRASVPYLLVVCGSLACSSTAATNDAAVDRPAATDDDPSAACPAGQVFVYDQGCDMPTGHCTVEITDAGATVRPLYCGCDGSFLTDNTGARRPWRSPWPCPTPDAGVDSGAATDTGGVCCPITASEGCSGVDVSIGGWASSMAACTTTTWFDGYPMTRMTDEHGCPVLRENRDATQCGSVRIDAGTD
jgi:hypothetical protein